MLDMVPDLIERKKVKGKELPTEVFIKKKRQCFFLAISYFKLRVSIFEPSCFLQREATSNGWK